MNSVGIIGAGAAGIMAGLGGGGAGGGGTGVWQLPKQEPTYHCLKKTILWERKWGLRARAAVT